MRSAATYISVDGLSFSYPSHRVLSDISFTVNQHTIGGLIGENGAGKSTLLSLIAGELEPEQGHIFVPDDTGFIAQETDLPFDSPASSLIEAAVAPIRAVEETINKLTIALGDENPSSHIAEEFDAALGAAEELGLWSLESRIAEILAGLGLADVDSNTPIRELSGGQRRRFALAALLLQPANAMILDEPTNHLDDTAVDFLIAELQKFSGPILLSSHDRFFLDHIATELIDLDPALGPEGGAGEEVRQATAFGGGFSEYLAERESRRSRWAQLYTAQEAERAKLETTAGVEESDIFHRSVSKSESKISQKFYADRAAKTQGNRVRSAKNRLEVLERHAIPAPSRPLEFQGIPDFQRRAAGESIELRSIAVEDRLAIIKLRVDPGDHILIEGPNGVGKSTLLSVIAGELLPTEGEIIMPEDLRIKRLSQDDEWTNSELAQSAAEIFEKSTSRKTPSLVEMGLLSEESAVTKLGDLSQGQRRRVALGLILASPPDVLLLDEPTNHLSLALSEELEDAIMQFPGRVVLASHDRWIRQRWSGKRIRLGEL